MSKPWSPSLVAAPQGGWGPPPAGPPRRSGAATGCAIVAGVVVLVIIGSCVALRFFGPSLVRRGVQAAQRDMASLVAPAQRQAEALGRTPPDTAAACAANDARLAQAMPCDAYVAWIQQNAPYFPGATLRLARVSQHYENGGPLRADITVEATGPNGTGALDFTLQRDHDVWSIDSVRHTVSNGTP